MKSVNGVIVGLGLVFMLLGGCTTQGGNREEEQSGQGVTIKGRINYPVEKRFFIETINESATAFVPFDTVILNEDNSFNA